MIFNSKSKRGHITNYNPFEDFMHTVPPVAYVSNPVQVHDATFTNVCPAGIMADPLDPTKKLFWRSEFLGPHTDGCRTKLYTGSDINDPYDLGTLYGIVLQGSESYDIEGCRFGTPLIHPSNGELWYYYVGVDATFKWRICLATSTDGGRTYTKQGVVLDFDDITDFSLSGPGVIIDDDGTWLMCYTEWSGVGGVDDNPGVSDVGIKLATSSDGISWTKTGTFLIAIGTDMQIEDGTFYKMGDTYVILYTARTAANAWGCFIAASRTRNATFQKIRPMILIPNVLTACPYMFRFQDGFNYSYYQRNVTPGTNDIDVSKHIPII